MRCERNSTILLWCACVCVNVRESAFECIHSIKLHLKPINVSVFLCVHLSIETNFIAVFTILAWNVNRWCGESVLIRGEWVRNKNQWELDRAIRKSIGILLNGRENTFYRLDFKAITHLLQHRWGFFALTWYIQLLLSLGPDAMKSHRSNIDEMAFNGNWLTVNGSHKLCKQL